MIHVGKVAEIDSVKSKLTELQKQGLVKTWEIPYEHLVTRLTSAMFFIEPTNESSLKEIWGVLAEFPMFTYQQNTENSLSLLPWVVEFNKGFEL